MKKMTRLAIAFLLAAVVCVLPAAGQDHRGSQPDWRTRVQQMLPLLGHRNWILIVDSAYPLQTSPGVVTIDTGANDLDVLKEVLNAVDHSIHVRPIVYMDAELPFVTERDAAGVDEFRRQLATVLGNRPVKSLPHEQLLQKVDEVGKTFNILILKTNLTIPYTSVFLQLDCKYWSADDEARMRAAMKAASAHKQK